MSLQAPQDTPWGQTVAYVLDLNGFWVELCTYGVNGPWSP